MDNTILIKLLLSFSQLVCICRFFGKINQHPLPNPSFPAYQPSIYGTHKKYEQKNSLSLKFVAKPKNNQLVIPALKNNRKQG